MKFDKLNPFKKKSNWDYLQEREFKDDAKYRDVYETQELKRSKIDPKQTYFMRGLLALLIAAVVAGVMYGMIAMYEVFISYKLHLQHESLVGPFVKPEDVFLVDGKPVVYTKTDYVSFEDEKGRILSGKRFIVLDQDGKRLGVESYATKEEVPKPDWVNELIANAPNPDVKSKNVRANLEVTKSFDDGLKPDASQLLWSFAAGALAYLLITPFLKRNLESQNLMYDVEDINQYEDDQHIMLPEEIQEKFDWFPNAGAHSAVRVASMISHMALKNKGVNKVRVPKRAKKDIKDKNGNIIYYKSEVLLDEKGEPIYETVPMFDIDFMEDLFAVSGLPDDKSIRKYYDPTGISYNVGNKNRDKLSGYDRLVDLINGDWEIPDYEFLRPAGAYVVDTAPVNTMMLAITRAGKGMSYSI